MFISLKGLFHHRINTGNVISRKNEEIRRKNKEKEERKPQKKVAREAVGGKKIVR